MMLKRDYKYIFDNKIWFVYLKILLKYIGVKYVIIVYLLLSKVMFNLIKSDLEKYLKFNFL